MSFLLYVGSAAVKWVCQSVSPPAVNDKLSNSPALSASSTGYDRQGRCSLEILWCMIIYYHTVFLNSHLSHFISLLIRLRNPHACCGFFALRDKPVTDSSFLTPVEGHVKLMHACVVAKMPKKHVLYLRYIYPLAQLCNLLISRFTSRWQHCPSSIPLSSSSSSDAARPSTDLCRSSSAQRRHMTITLF